MGVTFQAYAIAEFPSALYTWVTVCMMNLSVRYSVASRVTLSPLIFTPIGGANDGDAVLGTQRTAADFVQLGFEKEGGPRQSNPSLEHGAYSLRVVEVNRKTTRDCECCVLCPFGLTCQRFGMVWDAGDLVRMDKLHFPSILLFSLQIL